MSYEFASVLTQADGVKATGIPVTAIIVSQLPARNAKVDVRVRRAESDTPWFRYTTAVGSRGGVSLLSFSAAYRAESGLAAGDPLDVSIEVAAAP